MVVFLDRFFSFGIQKKWLLVALDMWLSYTVMAVREFALADSGLVVLDKWSSYRGGPLNRFYCTFFCIFEFPKHFLYFFIQTFLRFQIYMYLIQIRFQIYIYIYIIKGKKRN